MPYLALDLDAKKRCERIARARSLHPGVVIYALMEAWETAWRAKRSTLTNLELSGCVGPDQMLVGDFCEMGFLEAEGAGWRVKGADRYLRIRKAQSEAGKLHAENLKKGAAGPKTEPENSREAAPALPPGIAGEEPGKVPFSGDVSANSSKQVNSPGGAPALPPGLPGEDSRLLRSSSDDRLPTIVLPPSEVVAAPPPRPPPKDSGAGFFARVAQKRHEHGIGPDREPHPSALATWFTKAMLELNGDDGRLWATYDKFTDDKFWRDKQPQWPFEAFMKEWPRYVVRRAS